MPIITVSLGKAVTNMGISSENRQLLFTGSMR